MNDLIAIPDAGQSGYRLVKLELYNWGTFDGSEHTVHTVHPDGATTLLVGQNGSGKSTLVDAILTLLVRPGIRNYNVAAGGHKQERDERTYIRGAYGRFSRDDDQGTDIHYLRPGRGYYSAILACFRNEKADAFTLAQVLHLGNENAVNKVFAIAADERTIAEDLSNLTGTEHLRRQLQDRGFRTTTRFNEYAGWFERVMGVKPKAMDMFNQTVAVKDIRSLNTFIRDHMLEVKPWQDKIAALQNHFDQLSEAHRNLVRVRQQAELLQPVMAAGERYVRHAESIERAELMVNGADLFFRLKTVALAEPLCAEKEAELERSAREQAALTDRLNNLRDQIGRLNSEIQQAGGNRLRELPSLIQTEALQAQTKREAWRRVRDSALKLGLSGDIHSAESLARFHAQLPKVLEDLDRTAESLDGQCEEQAICRRELSNRMAETLEELESLERRQGNLPERLVALRCELCSKLQLPERDLPFAAELIAVRPDQREWQASTELVLRSFAMNLLVPSRHYNVVSGYIEKTRLRDRAGRGQRLVYLRVGELGAPTVNRPVLRRNSLVRKLEFREGRPLTPWVRAQVEDRFDLLCCETIEEFQAAGEMAMTAQRHVKWRGQRHEKDDRERAADPRHFVLGWDNREKRRHLTAEVDGLTPQIAKVNGAIKRLREQLDRIASQRAVADQVKGMADFGVIDFGTHEREKKTLQEEKRKLEESNDTIRLLRKRVGELEELSGKLGQDKEAAIRAEVVAKRDLHDARKLLEAAAAQLKRIEAEGMLESLQNVLPAIEDTLAGQELRVDTLHKAEQDFTGDRRAELERCRKEAEPLKDALTGAMNKYLRQFQDERADLDAGVDYLDSFRALTDQIRRDDLPRHESRFKARLNEKVIHEIGILNGEFHSERSEIRNKIDLLNRALAQLEYRPGTFMQLTPKETRDREIADFQAKLRECLADSFEGTLEADETRYLRIEKLLTRLREEDRWRDKVTDVRKWFDFAARELDVTTHEERSYHEDSTGQSGGEKAKLAFTILVAAIAYQYDIDPARPASDRFRFVVVDEMFSKVDDQYAEYALELFKKFGLQLLIVAPLDAKARVTEPYVGCYLHVVKDPQTNQSEILSMTAREFEDSILSSPNLHAARESAE